MSHRLNEASMYVTPGATAVVPLRIEGLPEEIDALGTHFKRKAEFHMTAVPAELLERAIGDRAELWERAAHIIAGRSAGPITAGEELRRVHHPDRPEILTLIVMVDAPGLLPIYSELSAALGAEIVPPPTHVTLYSSDPWDGIGIVDRQQLDERAPELSDAEQREARAAMSLDAVLFR